MADDIPGYAYGAPGLPANYTDLQRRREMALALMKSRGRIPQSLGEGIGYLGQSIGDALIEKQLNDEAKAQATLERGMFASAPGSEVPGMPPVGGSLAPPPPPPSQAAPAPPGNVPQTQPAPTPPRPIQPQAGAPNINTGGYQYTGSPLPAASEAALVENTPPELQPYMRRMAQAESSGRSGAVSPTGASGILQFTRGTGRDYGLVSPRGAAEPFDRRQDDAAAFAAGTRLTQDNARRIEAVTGQPATLQQLAVAHQQGFEGWRRLNAGQLPPTGNLTANRLDPAAGAAGITERINRYYGFPGAAPGAGASVEPRDDMAATLARGAPTAAAATGTVSDAPPIGVPPMGGNARAGMAATMAGVPPPPAPVGPGIPMPRPRPGIAAAPTPTPRPPGAPGLVTPDMVPGDMGGYPPQPQAAPAPAEVPVTAGPPTVPTRPTQLADASLLSPRSMFDTPGFAATNQGIQPRPPGATVPAPGQPGATVPRLPSAETIEPDVEPEWKDPGAPPARPNVRPYSRAQQYWLNVMNADVSQEAKIRAKQYFDLEEGYRSSLTAQDQETYRNERERWEKKKDEYEKGIREAPAERAKRQSVRLANEKSQADLEKMYFEAGEPRRQAIIKDALAIKKAEQDLASPDVQMINGVPFQRPKGDPNAPLVPVPGAPPRTVMIDGREYQQPAGQPTAPVTLTPGQPEPKEDLTQVQSDALQFVNRVRPDLDLIKKEHNGKILTYPMEVLRARFGGDYFASAAYQKVRNAEIVFEGGFMKIMSGAAVNPHEAQRNLPAFIAAVGDTDEELARKAERRENFTRGAEAVAGKKGREQLQELAKLRALAQKEGDDHRYDQEGKKEPALVFNREQLLRLPPGRRVIIIEPDGTRTETRRGR